MEKQDAGPILCLKPGLQKMYRETVDVADNARTDAGRQWQGRKGGDIHVDDGCVSTALDERGVQPA
jgi:hypothetical protein